jgi:predicted Zn-dependent peptidase
LSFPAPVDANQVIGQQQWASIFTPSDPAPQNLMALAKATKIVSLGQPNIQAALMTRRTQGDKVWFVLDNDFGSPTSLRARKTACSAANALIPYGGNGLSRDALSAQMEQDQAVWHVSLDKIYLEVPRKNLSHALSTLLGVWSAPTLPRDEFDRYQQAQLAAYQASLKDPVKLADNQLRLRFNNYDAGDWNEPRSLQHLIQATSAMTYDDVVQCSRDFSAMSHARIGVVGNLSEQELQSMWRAVSAPLKAKEGYERTPLPSAPQNVDASAIVVTQPDTPNARVTGLSVIALNSHSPDYPALQLAVFAIGGNSSSLIWQQIREQEGLAYASGMHLVASAFDQRASVELFATASSANASKALLSLQSILDKVIQDGFTPAQIEQAKAIWLEKRKAFLGEESLFAASLASGLYDGQDFLYLAHLDEQLAKLDSVTVTQVLRRYLKPSAFVWATGKGTP